MRIRLSNMEDFPVSISFDTGADNVILGANGGGVEVDIQEGTAITVVSAPDAVVSSGE